MNLRNTYVAMVLVAGCAHYAPTMQAAEAPSAQSAYFYGHFFIDSREGQGGGLSLDSNQTMGLVMGCDDGMTYTIRFASSREVQVIRIAPARCALAEVVFTDSDGVVRRRGRPPARWSRQQQFAAGMGYYLGDYLAVARFESTFELIQTRRVWSWAWDWAADDEYNYAQTTAKMKRAYPLMAALATEDRRLAPRPFQPSGGPPGAPPLSPQRAAGIARFLRPAYSTQAACQADCPKGQCFPSQNEKAFACIVHCEADKDCPTGLACNCTDGDDPDCRKIATTPSDSMDGFCLSPDAAAAPPP